MLIDVMVSERLEKILENSHPQSMIGRLHEPNYSVWYNSKNGIIWAVGDGNPYHNKPYIRCVEVRGDERGPLPILTGRTARITKAIEYVLQQIKEYRIKSFDEHYD